MENKKTASFWVKPIVFILGLIASIWLVLWIEKIHPSDFGFYKDIFKREELIQKSEDYPLRATKVELDNNELEMAKIAWKYFENNTISETGIVNSVDKYNSTTLWDIGSSIHAFLSAYELNIISKAELDNRMNKLFETLNKLKLYDNKLPNKVYNSISTTMSTYDNRPTETGIGWSAMDLGRFLGACKRLIFNYPEHNHLVQNIISKWDFSLAVEDATLMGIGLSFKDGVEKRVQEGKLGYEEYCAKGFIQMGYDASNALLYTDFLTFVNVNGIKIGTDSRQVKHHPSYNYVLSDPYILDGLEYGFDINSLELGYRVFLAQKLQSEKVNKLISVGETHIDQAPYFIYNSIFTNGKLWNCVSESGEDANDLKTFSTAAAIGWHYLFDDPYSTKLFHQAKDLYDKQLGFYSGIYEVTGKHNKAATCNVNSLVLCAINYKSKGPLIFNK
ncbi:MAG: DUF3131 domain-containing protein [Bacteroidota bacterium]|nr:DUF3131 domain-containing protein [Bacteroidota bacterium]